MSRTPPTQSKNYSLVEGQVRANTPVSVVEIIASQLDRADDARKRIEAEGAVVRDMRGSVIPHPAVSIEMAAGKMAAELLSKNMRPK